MEQRFYTHLVSQGDRTYQIKTDCGRSSPPLITTHLTLDGAPVASCERSFEMHLAEGLEGELLHEAKVRIAKELHMLMLRRLYQGDFDEVTMEALRVVTGVDLQCSMS